ncbi:hypothetical protein [Amycolatopsis pithecellobii]|uniref:Uncharacterized protein n=1 Tax=Amycolatopsis pithecellobii TaxID=664692 RepID=A0A6N7YZ36_9PSEU|nr:hypothetical protein [Amycolatopsis pithecellobii]MTD57168.1 hypothetical protein [Amycolatopsis pithecellobii]
MDGVDPLAIASRVEHDRWLLPVTDPYPALTPWRITAYVDRSLARNLDIVQREVGHVSLLQVDLRRDWPDSAELALPELGATLDFLAEIAADPTTGRLIDELESALSPGPAAAVVVREIKLEFAWREDDLYAPLLSAALDACTSFARVALVNTDPHTDVRRRRFPDPSDRERLATVEADMLENAGFGEYRGYHLASLTDPAYRALNTEIVLSWLLERLTTRRAGRMVTHHDSVSKARWYSG